MSRKSIFIPISIAMFVLCSAPAYASDGTITFTGSLTATTCTVALNNGTASGTVVLPNVSTSVLKVSGDVAGATNFQLDLSNCTVSSTVKAYFEAGPTVNTVTGALINAGTASNVEVQLVTDGGTPIAIGNSGQATSTGVTITVPGTTSGALNYVARYRAKGVTTAGTVTSSVTYSLTYS
ncbi:fimbrial protein [Sphingomonas sp. NFR15]|uniref:fimbrial protein n=1 Tax=Sphingomonas sp. NFR15 TaxID=1566282 RepID=UPI000883F153|nr:fimbrial protein [Sphingomonas sp. NFR15]SDA36181.1 major type 1 subunit fimbrin (pilin) [Sphingomonas sp. NFR15]